MATALRGIEKREPFRVTCSASLSRIGSPNVASRQMLQHSSSSSSFGPPGREPDLQRGKHAQKVHVSTKSRSGSLPEQSMDKPRTKSVIHEKYWYDPRKIYWYNPRPRKYNFVFVFSSFQPHAKRRRTQEDEKIFDNHHTFVRHRTYGEAACVVRRSPSQRFQGILYSD